MKQSIAEEMQARLAALEPTRLEVIDESEQHRGHGRHVGRLRARDADHLRPDRPLSRIQQHRLVHATLGDIVPRIHALALELSAG